MQIKPCKCGETAEYDCVHVATVVAFGVDYETYVVICENCDEETDEYDTPYEAIEAWNKRVGDTNEKSCPNTFKEWSEQYAD